MDWFLERHHLPTLTQEEIDNLDGPMFIRDTESMRTAFSNGKHQAQRSALMNSPRHLRKSDTDFLPSLLEDRSWGITSQVILWGQHHPKIKTRQRHFKKRRLETNISYGYRYKNPLQNISKSTPTLYRKNYVPQPYLGFISDMQGWFDVQKSIDLIDHIMRLSW